MPKFSSIGHSYQTLTRGGGGGFLVNEKAHAE